MIMILILYNWSGNGGKAVTATGDCYNQIVRQPYTLIHTKTVTNHNS